MTVTSVTLSDPASGLSVPLLPADGIAVQSLDVSAPARAVTESRAGARGAVDTTRNTDGGAVSLSLLLYPGTTQTPEKFLDTVGPLLDPGRRPNLVVGNDQWAGPRQVTLRFDSKAAPLSDPTNWPVQLSFAAPGGAWEDAVLSSASIGAFIPSSTGLTWDVGGMQVTSAGFMVWPATSSPSPQRVISAGSVPSQWQALLYGPCTAPKLANDTTGQALEFTSDLVLHGGDYVLLDSTAQSAQLNSDPSPSASVLGSLNFATSDWWLVQPGLNVLRYYPSSADPGAQAQVSFRAAWPL